MPALRHGWPGQARLLPRGSNAGWYTVRVNGVRSPPLAEADVLPDPELTPLTFLKCSCQGWVTPSLMVGGAGQGGVGPATDNSEPTVL
jgi:hypothetical protein